MSSQPTQVTTPPAPSLDTHPTDRPPSATASRIQVAALRCRVAALEAALARERQRRQAVVDRYERLLEERS